MYPDLVKVFYTNRQFDGQNICTHLKGVDMLITPKEWFAITGLRHEGQQIERKALEDFNKTQFFKTCMRNPNEEVKSFGVGKLAITSRILKLLIVWILTPRGSNHATFTEEDLMLLYCLINKVKVDWVFTMKDHMFKAQKLNDYKLPYAILISRMLEFFEVDLVDELVENLKTTSEINQSMLNRIGLQKVNGAWTYKGGDSEGVGSSGVAGQEDAKLPHTTKAPMLPFVPPPPHQEPMTSFERLMISRMDIITEEQVTHHE